MLEKNSAFGSNNYGDGPVAIGLDGRAYTSNRLFLFFLIIILPPLSQVLYMYCLQTD